MAGGDGEANEGAQQAAWESFADGVAELLAAAAVAGLPTSGAEGAETLRHVARQLAVALEGELEHADPAHPSLHRYELPWSQWGGPNPDNVYLRCAIDPGATYVVRGTAGGAREALFSAVGGDMHLGRDDVHGEVALSDLALGADGAFALTVGPDDGAMAPQGAQAHVSTGGAAQLLLVRQYLWDWNELPGPLTVARVGTAGEPPSPPSAADVGAALDRAVRWARASVTHWAAYAEGARRGLPTNAFTPPRTPPGGAPSIGYGAGWWQLADDESLVVEVDVPDARYWGWTVHRRHWFDAGDWQHRCTSRNGAQLHADPDGRVRIVVAPADPGAPNWIDTQGAAEGMLVYRYVGARTRPVPDARVVAAGAVRELLPPEHPVVSPEARRAELATRDLAAQRRWS